MEISAESIINEQYLKSYIDSIIQYSFEKIHIPEINNKKELIHILKQVSQSALTKDYPEKIANLLCKMIEGFTVNKHYYNLLRNDKNQSSSIFNVAYEFLNYLDKDTPLYYAVENELHSGLFFKNSQMVEKFIDFYNEIASKEFKDYFLNIHIPYIINKAEAHHHINMIIYKTENFEFLKNNSWISDKKYLYGNLNNSEIFEESQFQYRNIFRQYYTDYVKNNRQNFYSQNLTTILDGFIGEINSINIDNFNKARVLFFNILAHFFQQKSNDFSSVPFFHTVYCDSEELNIISEDFEQSITNDDKHIYFMVKQSCLEKQNINSAIGDIETNNTFLKKRL